ncbi:MAG: carbon monoxide dehydrogenase subunit G [Gammaproteobacteria bacterium]|nr:carbon monoxide dehydrogenase subunit G [Gammaproteobacteria bacterium]
MKFEGESLLTGPRDAVWDALHDPRVLERATPGCQSLSIVEPDSYALVTKIGVASISGTYKGSMRLGRDPGREQYVLFAEGAGPIGTLSVAGQVALQARGAATAVNYSFEVTVGGAMTGLAQRALLPIAKLLTKQFFKGVEQALVGDAAPAPAERLDA